MSVLLTDKLQPRTTGIAITVVGDMDVTGNVSVAGTLTYEDVTNIDSLGIITARSGVNVSAGTLTAAEGINVTAGIVTVNDYIQHAGDTNTALRFPSADTFTVETGGSEALRVDSSQRLLLGTTASRSIADGTPNLQVEGTAGTASLGLVRNQNNAGGSNLSFAKSRSGSLAGNTIVQDDDTLGNINFAIISSGDNAVLGQLPHL